MSSVPVFKPTNSQLKLKEESLFPTVPCEPVLNRNVPRVFHPMSNQSVEMTCEVERCMYPPPTFEWRMQWWPCRFYPFDPDCLPTSTWLKDVKGKITTSGYKSTLSVHKYMQFGFFMCTAKNFVGEQSIVYRLIGRYRAFANRAGVGKKKKR